MDEPETELDRLWKEYAETFADFDDLTLSRWMAQTLGQLRGKSWRLSHPLVGCYRLASQVAHDRQIWLKKLATAPYEFQEAACCRAPLLPLLTRDVLESGIICLSCNETAIPFEEIPELYQPQLRNWVNRYAPSHSVAHWDDRQRRIPARFESALQEAIVDVVGLLRESGSILAPALLAHFPAVVWEDQDECLEVRPEDLL
jgi:hypothetical protein